MNSNIAFSILLNAGNAYYTQGNYQVAAKYYHALLDCYSKNSAQEDRDLAIVFQNLGNTYHEIGDFPQAEKFLLESLRVFNSLELQENFEVVQLKAGLANTLRVQGRFQDAADLITECILKGNALVGQIHQDMGHIWLICGNIFMDSGRTVEAIEAFKVSAEIAAKYRGIDSQEYLVSVGNLAYGASSLGAHQEARELMSKLLVSIKSIFGVSHHMYASYLLGYGRILRKAGDLQEAIKVLHEATKILENISGPPYTELISSLQSLGETYVTLGNIGAAKQVFLRATKLAEA